MRRKPGSIALAPVGLGCLRGCLLLSGVLAGCLSPEQQFAPDIARSTYLPYLKEGVVTRKDLETRLGEPTIRLAGGRILGYELLYFSRYGATVYEPFVVSDPRQQSEFLLNTGRVEVLHHNPSTPEYAASRVAEWSLVAVFDEQDRLKAYRISSVMPLPPPPNSQ